MIICPVCNEIALIKFRCEKCNKDMIDKGRVQDYEDPYGADIPIDDEDKYCTHIFKCPNCSYEKIEKIVKVAI